MGLFVSFIPTPLEAVDRFYELAPISSADVVYDLGSGDGRLLFAALERGAARAVGIDLNAARVEDARNEAMRRGLESKVDFLNADVMDVNLAEATVVVCYLFSTASAALKPKFEAELGPGTRVVMESFPVHGWVPVRTISLPQRTFYLYVMPPQSE